MFTITMTVLRILEKKYTKNTKVTEVLESLQRADEINMKVVDTPSPLDSSPSLNLPQPPSSEGILTRNTSLRSNFTTATSAAASHTGPYGHDPMPRRHVGHPATAITRRPLPPLSPTSSTPANPSAATAGFVVFFLVKGDGDESALVADGMQHRPHHQQQPHHQRHPSRDQGPHHHLSPFPRMPMLSEEAQTADAALVSDGMRPSEPMLPPYHPGNRRMSGHGGEDDNEMRLSGYVKGQTRAQDMKDSGRY